MSNRAPWSWYITAAGNGPCPLGINSKPNTRLSRVRLKATCIARESTYAYTLHGMKGSFLQQRSDMQENELLAGTKPSLENWCPAPSSPDGLLHTEINGEVIRKKTTSSPGNYMGYYDDVYKALTGQGANPVPAEDAIKNMIIIEAALESASGKKIVNLKGGYR